jgi:hypothetical protein
VMHEDFAERIAERLEARADVLEHENRSAVHSVVVTRAEELRTAAAMAREEAATVTQEEAPPPEAQA